jgi:hypothetical protein
MSTFVKCKFVCYSWYPYVPSVTRLAVVLSPVAHSFPYILFKCLVCFFIPFPPLCVPSQSLQKKYVQENRYIDDDISTHL